jgi:UPF0176 protein
LNIAVEHDDHRFLKLTIKVRDKIVADGLNDERCDQHRCTPKSEEFNEILDDPNTIVVDFRNHYESEIGYFKGAITPDVDTFRVRQLCAAKNWEDKNNNAALMHSLRKSIGLLTRFQECFSWKVVLSTCQIKKNLENKFIGKNFVLITAWAKV